MSLATAITGAPSLTKCLVDENVERNDLAAHKTTIVTSSTGGSVASVAIRTAEDLSSTSLPAQVYSIEHHCRVMEAENKQLKESEARLQQQCSDCQRRERLLMRKLANKEQELQDYVAQIAEYKNSQAPAQSAIRSALLDPAVNILFEKLKRELQLTKAALEETQNELSAWKFTPDSNTGKRLMAKCRLLYQENEELGKMTSNGRLAKLEGELAMQKSFSEEVKKSQSELDDFIQELDEDVEGMQSTILFLQQELKAAKDRIQYLEKEHYQAAKNNDKDIEDDSGKCNGKSSSHDTNEYYPSEERTPKYTKHSTTYHIVHNSNNSIILRTSNILADEISRKSNVHNGKHNDSSLPNKTDTDSEIIKAQNDLVSTTVNNCSSNRFLESNTGSNNISSLNNKSHKNISGQKKRHFDSDSSDESSSTNGCTLRNNKKLKKKARRSSVLSIDLNEEDTQIADESDTDEIVNNVNSNNQRIMTRRKSSRNHQNGDH